MASEDDAALGEDTSEVTKLFHERLQAWKHACGYIEDYIATTEKMQSAHHKEYEKAVKIVSQPLREGDHFESSLGGVNEMFDGIRGSTQNIANAHLETARTLKSVVLPIFERLHTEIKNKQKELAKGVGKGSKSVDKARETTQKHIQLLGQHAASTATTGGVTGKPNASNDPYVLQKGVYHRLNKQIVEENGNRSDMLTVQSSFSQFEAHVMQSFQQGFGHFMQTMGGQLDNQKAMYTQMVQRVQTINPLFEWNSFVQRKNDVLIDPNAAPRSIDNVSFPNQNHGTTQALIQGSLERKSGVLRKFDAGFYAITQAKFFHEFKTDDNLSKDPKPEMSLYLPDCEMGGLNSNTFSVKGKDTSGVKALGPKTEYTFKAHTDADASKWYSVIESLASGRGSGPGSIVTSPTSATGSNVTSPVGSVASRSTSQAYGNQSPASAGGYNNQTPTSAGGYGGMGPVETGTTGSFGGVNRSGSGMERKPGEY
ncbi:MAG: hypothetical protein Q9159_004481 [Coniocarpon cinnabarinum]